MSAQRRKLALALTLAITPTAIAQNLNAPEDNPLITDLNAHLIAITSNFTGTELLLFGSVNVEGDVIVVVRGPEGPVTIRKKDRVAGVWLNRESVTFEDAPSFYALASNAPWTEIVSPSLASRLEIGLVNLRVEPVGDSQTEEERAAFKNALLRHRMRERLYQETSGVITFLGPRLFRTRIVFPATVPVGSYRAEVYLIQNGNIAAAQATPLFVDKQGVEEAVFSFAHERPLAYGIATLALCLFIGWGAAAAFRQA